MTRTTLKALLGGGGMLATWLAVSPTNGVPATSPTTAVQRPAASSEPEELNAQVTRLGDHRTAAALRESTRNPFRFNLPKPAPSSTTPRERVVQAAIEPPVPAVPPPPVMRLSGVAQKAGTRIAIISSDGQIYLVGEGDSVAGRYTVVKVDPEAVLLRDAAGVDQRLVLPQ